MKRSYFFVLIGTLVMAGAGVLIRAYARPPTDPPFQEKERQAENGGTAESLAEANEPLTLSAVAQVRIGVQTKVLQAVSTRQRVTVPAVVLSAESVAASRNAYIAAQARLEKARVNLGVAEQEYARVRKLYRDNQNVSKKAFQAAQGAVRADRIDVRAAKQQLGMQTTLVRQRWGPVVARWTTKPSPALDGVLEQTEFFVQVSLPPGEFYSPPATVWLALPGARQRPAHFVSSLPQVDPRVQGTSLLYLTHAATGLAPGVTLMAGLPVGRRMRGVVVPSSAVVWSEGEAWVYVQTAPESFVRRPLGAGFSFDGGYFTGQGLRSGAKVVVSGAQTLLSEELSPKGAAQPEDEDDD